MTSEIKRPRTCGECARFIRDPDLLARGRDGWCDNWGGVPLRKDDVCHPNYGVKREERQQ